MKYILVLIFVIVGCKRKTTTTVQYVPKQDTVFYDSMPYYVNQYRKELNLDTLIIESNLNLIAKKWVEQMILEKQLSHNGFTQREEYSKSSYLLENVAYNFRTQKKMFEAYLNSPGHKKNIIDEKVNYIGSFTSEKYNCCLFAYY